MAVVRCNQGHYYDNEKFSRCPHCGIFAGRALNRGADAVPGGSAVPAQRRPEDEGHTVALDVQGTGTYPGRENEGHTISLDAPEPVPGDDQRTVSFYSDVHQNDFVTGWLVCVKGPERGRDHRLYHDFNRIGRGYGMTVTIEADPCVSRKNHCSVVYDAKSNRFYLVPENGNLVYLNGEHVTLPAELHTGDILSIGSGEYEFVAFCREGRTWEKE